MAEAAILRQALAAFLGEERFRKFVRQGVRRGRLRYWQAQEWARFTAAHPESAVSLEELEAALRVCELHGRELLPDSVGVIRACVDYADGYIEAWNRLFPHAAPGPVSTEGAPFEQNRVDVWYCPVCREARTKWMSGCQPRWSR